MIRFRINDVLDRRDWTAYRLALESGLNHSVIWKIQSGKARRVDVNTLNRLCEVLQCTVGELIEYVPDKPTGKRKDKKR
jgi:putative transcriptional regulator